MAFVVSCECGASYNLKDEFAGKQVQCPTCHRVFDAAPAAPFAARAQADPIFARDKFLLRQKVVAINQKYHVSDEQNRPILFVERPAHLGQNLLAIFAGLAVALIVGFGGVLAVAMAGGNGEPSGIEVALMIAAGVVAVVGGIAVGIALSAKRHVNFYTDESRSTKFLEILQDRKFQPINATYTVRDSSGNVLALLHKNYLYNIFRKRWYCYSPDKSQIIAVAKEDSALLSLLRRFLGPMYGLLRTNFLIFERESDNVIGEFNRKFTLFDRYVLDFTADPTRELDRRIGLALGMMLDTGERR